MQAELKAAQEEIAALQAEVAGLIAERDRYKQLSEAQAQDLADVRKV